MQLPPGFLMRIAKATHPSEEGPYMMSIIIKHPFSHLEKELRSAFEAQDDVKVIVDRRYGQRRRKMQPVEMELRRVHRRSPKEELVEVLIST